MSGKSSIYCLLEHTRALCVEVAPSLGVSQRFVVTNFNDSYWNLGGNSQNIVVLIERLKVKSYDICKRVCVI